MLLVELRMLLRFLSSILALFDALVNLRRNGFEPSNEELLPAISKGSPPSPIPVVAVDKAFSLAIFNMSVCFRDPDLGVEFPTLRYDSLTYSESWVLLGGCLSVVMFERSVCFREPDLGVEVAVPR